MNNKKNRLLFVSMLFCMLGIFFSNFALAQTEPTVQALAPAEETVTTPPPQVTVPVQVQTSAPVLPAKPVQTFNHLRVFSIGGLVVLFCLLTGMSAGSVWVLIFAVFMNQWGWLTFPDSLAWLQTPAVHKIIWFLLILNVLLSSGMVIDIALILLISWVVINGVFVDTPTIGRWLVVLFMMGAAAAGRCGVAFASVGALASGLSFLVKIIRILYVFLSLWIMSIWL